MKSTKFYLLFVLYLFATQSMAINQGGFDYKIITGDLKSTPGCKNKEVAAKQASTGYRYKKYSKVLCQYIGYGWTLDKVVDKGELVCEPCDGDVEKINNYQCYVKDITLKCVLTKRGW